MPLADATPGGVWSSDDVSKATISAGGVVTGVASGTATRQVYYNHYLLRRSGGYPGNNSEYSTFGNYIVCRRSVLYYFRYCGGYTNRNCRRYLQLYRCRNIGLAVVVLLIPEQAQADLYSYLHYCCFRRLWCLHNQHYRYHNRSPFGHYFVCRALLYKCRHSKCDKDRNSRRNL